MGITFKRRTASGVTSPHLVEVQLLEHGHADLVVQTYFGLKPFDPEFGDSW